MKIRCLLRDIQRALSLKQFVANRRYLRQCRSPYPIPNSYLRVLTIASANLRWYLDYGRKNTGAIFETLARYGINYAVFKRILDFGCGAGRILRHARLWTDAKLWGADNNRLSIGWCKRNLPVAGFIHNTPLPPLPFDDGYFDFVYALSVFTHLPEEAEKLWIQELNRIIRPEGIFLLTLRGKSYFYKLNDHEQHLFRVGKPVVRHPDESGKNHCDSYHPVEHIVQAYLSKFELIAHIESPKSFVPYDLPPETDPGQDVLVLKRRCGLQ